MKLQTLIDGLMAVCLGAIIFLGCSTLTITEKTIQRDLLGHTTGGRESSWHFQRGQIQHLIIDNRDGNDIFVSVVLHDPRSPYTYDAKLKLTYRNGTLQTVGLLSIQQR